MNRTLARAFLAGAVAVATAGLARADVTSMSPSFDQAPVPTLHPDGIAPPLASNSEDAVQPLYAQDAATQPAAAEPAPAAAPAAKKIGGSISATLTSKYISRGLILNNSGAIVQPSAEIDFDLFDSKDGPINNIAPYVGGWSDLTDNHRFAHSTLRGWYEFDWDFGASVTFLTNWNFNVQYIEFTSPSASFGTSKNIIPQLTFDDSSLWTGDTMKNLAFGLHPYVAGLFETNGKAGSGAHLGQYLEPGINPSVTFGASGSFPISVTVPIKVGLGFSDFYGGANAGHNQTLGYESVGVQVAFPAKFIDATLGGAWSVNVGGAYYHYENGTHAFNAANVGYTSRDDVIGAVGLLCKF
jgi:hypothetical protein